LLLKSTDKKSLGIRLDSNFISAGKDLVGLAATVIYISSCIKTGENISQTGNLFSLGYMRTGRD
jgi:hypothetical protein